MMMIGIASAFFAPPFSGLDTFPALGVVLISLGLVLLDVSFLIIGCAVVLVSIILELTIGAALIVYLRNLILHGSKQSYVTAGVVLGILTVLFAVRWYRSHRG